MKSNVEYHTSGLEAVSLRFEHVLCGEPGQEEEPLYSWGHTLYTLELPTNNPNRHLNIHSFFF
jgi:hypothetical protein